MKRRWMFGLMAFVAFVSTRPAAAQSGAGVQFVDPLPDQAAVEEAGRRSELIATILTARESAAGRRFDSSLRKFLGDRISSVPLNSLEAFAAAGGLGDIDALVRDAVAPKRLGDAAADLAFTPVTPCRIVDTRSSAAGLLVAGTAQSFFVRNAGGFASQGGSATDCGIPATATSVEMNYVAVGPAGPGDIRAFAFGGSLPTASVLNYSNVAGLNIANGIAQPVCNPATTTCTKDLTVQADVSNTHLVIDVVGYFKSTGPVLPGANLQTGSTVRGFWGQGWTASAAGEFHETYLAFVFTLASAPAAHFIPLGGTPPAGCPGTSANPQADPGHLCVYEDNTGNTSSKLVCSSVLCPAATRWGAQIRGNSAAAGSSWMRGTWAVTAP